MGYDIGNEDAGLDEWREQERMALDAARWRFFLEHAQSFWDGKRLLDWLGFNGVMRYGSMDAAIDAAMAAEGSAAGAVQDGQPAAAVTLMAGPIPEPTVEQLDAILCKHNAGTHEGLRNIVREVFAALHAKDAA
jgi:hypothetical protein